MLNMLKINILIDGIFYGISCTEEVWNFPANDMSAALNIRVKSKLTEKIIEMHKKGYEYDFKVVDGPRVICLQDNVPFQNERVQICVIAQCFDSIAKQFKYIHTIETACGRKGLLLDDKLFTSPQSNSYFMPKF
ncbi:MAG: hypothetical protein EON51_01835 [Acinetobacter sp.]|nr:MAG: hypothetical protein EON51_01835 [Acinetobacter sp.]